MERVASWSPIAGADVALAARGAAAGSAVVALGVSVVTLAIEVAEAPVDAVEVLATELAVTLAAMVAAPATFAPGALTETSVAGAPVDADFAGRAVMRGAVGAADAGAGAAVAAGRTVVVGAAVTFEPLIVGGGVAPTVVAVCAPAGRDTNAAAAPQASAIAVTASARQTTVLID